MSCITVNFEAKMLCNAKLCRISMQYAIAIQHLVLTTIHSHLDSSPCPFWLQCCLDDGTFAPTSVMCEMDPLTQGYCNAGICASINCHAYQKSAAGYLLLDRFCGASSSSPCKAQCGPSDLSTCVDTSMFISGGYSLSNGAICTENGKKGVCSSGSCKITTTTTTTTSSGCASWHEESNRHCSGNTLSKPYFDLAEAKKACVDLGSGCSGIYSFGCNKHGFFFCANPEISMSRAVEAVCAHHQAWQLV